MLIFLLVLLVGSSTTTRHGVDALLPFSPPLACSCLTPLSQSLLQPPHYGTNNDSPITTTTTTIRAKRSSNSITSTALGAANNNNEKMKNPKAQGVYVRPSGAIEQGSGFFVPGLEGPKVRLVIGLVLLVATGVNHFVLGATTTTTTVSGEEGRAISFAEGTAVVYSVLLLFQSAVEYAKESYLPPPPSKGSSSKAAAGRKIRDSFAAAAAATEVLEQQWDNNDNNSNNIGEQEQEEEYRSRVQWAAASYLSMTPTSQIMLLNFNNDEDDDEGGTIRYRLGGSETNKNDNNGSAPTVGAGVQAALDELRQSKGGRIALPLTHPGVRLLLPQSSTDSTTATDSSDDRRSSLRTVILQRITDNSCWMAASDQLLAGYTPGDLKWLGEMAEYVRI